MHNNYIPEVLSPVIEKGKQTIKIVALSVMLMAGVSACQAQAYQDYVNPPDPARPYFHGCYTGDQRGVNPDEFVRFNRSLPVDITEESKQPGYIKFRTTDVNGMSVTPYTASIPLDKEEGVVMSYRVKGDEGQPDFTLKDIENGNVAIGIYSYLYDNQGTNREELTGKYKSEIPDIEPLDEAPENFDEVEFTFNDTNPNKPRVKIKGAWVASWKLTSRNGLETTISAYIVKNTPQGKPAIMVTATNKPQGDANDPRNHCIIEGQ
jgi:hypothetical protein